MKYEIFTTPGDVPTVEMSGAFTMDDLRVILAEMEAAYEGELEESPSRLILRDGPEFEYDDLLD